MSLKVGFIGAGQMASAMIAGLLAAKTVRARDVIACDLSDERLRWLDEHGVRGTKDVRVVVEESDVVIVALKPGVIPAVLARFGRAFKPRHLVVSIAAGVTLDTLESLLPEKTRVVRVMPNTPCLVQETASAFSLGKCATEDDVQTVETILSAVGVSFRVPESKLDAVTGLSGSGPAYVYLFIEALADGGVRMGLPRNVALTLAAQTVLGAAKMVRETGQHPGALKDAVTSPGGTTIAGIHELERRGFRGTVMNAVEAAARRAHALSQPQSRL